MKQILLGIGKLTLGLVGITVAVLYTIVLPLALSGWLFYWLYSLFS